MRSSVRLAASCGQPISAVAICPGPAEITRENTYSLGRIGSGSVAAASVVTLVVSGDACHMRSETELRSIDDSMALVQKVRRAARRLLGIVLGRLLNEA